jgi:hypothetical protein
MVMMIAITPSLKASNRFFCTGKSYPAVTCKSAPNVRGGIHPCMARAIGNLMARNRWQIKGIQFSRRMQMFTANDGKGAKSREDALKSRVGNA